MIHEGNPPRCVVLLTWLIKQVYNTSIVVWFVLCLLVVFVSSLFVLSNPGVDVPTPRRDEKAEAILHLRRSHLKIPESRFQTKDLYMLYLRPLGPTY